MLWTSSEVSPNQHAADFRMEPEYNCAACPSNLHGTASSSLIFLGNSSNYQSLQVQLTRTPTR